MPRVVSKGVTPWPVFAFIGIEASVGSGVSGGMRAPVQFLGMQKERFEQHLGQRHVVGHWVQFNLFSCARRK